ncbi:hypothetical protein D3C80_1068970 [compost metagenome]
MQLVDGGSENLRFKDQGNMRRQDFHDRLACRDDAARRMIIGPHHRTVDRGADDGALQHLGSTAHLFPNAVEIGFRGFQRIECCLLVGIDGDDRFLLEFGDFGLALVHLAAQAGNVAHGVGNGALQRQHVCLADDAVLGEFFLGIAFLCQKCQLPVEGLLLPVITRITEFQ